MAGVEKSMTGNKKKGPFFINLFIISSNIRHTTGLYTTVSIKATRFDLQPSKTFSVAIEIQMCPS